MLAVIEQGGKQYFVKRGQVLSIEKIPANSGEEISIPSVKCVLDENARPLFGSGSVKAEVLAQEKGKKLVIFKKRRRKNSRRKNGHRQCLTVLRITDILV